MIEQLDQFAIIPSPPSIKDYGSLRYRGFSLCTIVRSTEIYCLIFSQEPKFVLNELATPLNDGY